MSTTEVDRIVAWLARRGRRRNRLGMARYGITSARAFGVSAATMRPLVRRLGRRHGLALALWRAGWHETRVLAALVDEPSMVTPAQMEAWARASDNWAVCDTVCLHLFDRTPHAPAKIRAWSRRRAEFVKRAAFALIAGVAVHDRTRPDGDFQEWLRIIEREAGDGRNYVRTAVSWALRQVGKRSVPLNGAALAVAGRLAGSEAPAARWVGTDARRELLSPAVQARLRRRRAAAPSPRRSDKRRRPQAY
ncbi:MAG: DNA alkylation repair protein [Acidobacteriota bacterium]